MSSWVAALSLVPGERERSYWECTEWSLQIDCCKKKTLGRKLLSLSLFLVYSACLGPVNLMLHRRLLGGRRLVLSGLKSSPAPDRTPVCPCACMWIHKWRPAAFASAVCREVANEMLACRGRGSRYASWRHTAHHHWLTAFEKQKLRKSLTISQQVHIKCTQTHQQVNLPQPDCLCCHANSLLLFYHIWLDNESIWVGKSTTRSGTRLNLYIFTCHC